MTTYYFTQDETLEDIAYFDAINDNKDVTLYRDNPDCKRIYDSVREARIKRAQNAFRDLMNGYLRGSVSKTEALELKNDYFRTRLTIRQRLDIWEEIHGDNND